MQPGLPVVISGPSGVGKGTLIQKLKEMHPGTFTFTVSHTTREPRLGEVEGVSYYFVSPAETTALIARDAFVEYTTFAGSMYGTSKQAISGHRDDKTLLLDIDFEGVKQMKSSPEVSTAARYVLIRPPSLAALEARLRGRGTETEEAIQRRLGQAKAKLDYAEATPWFHDIAIINDDVDMAYKELEEFVFPLSDQDIHGRV